MNIYVSGIGGSALGPLVNILLDLEFSVQGSDISRSLETDDLDKRGVAISYQQTGEFLRQQHQKQPIDMLVYTSALKPDHPELQVAHELGIKTAKRDELLTTIIQEHDLKLIAVAGTHGKTTTTGMLIWAFQQLGIPVSYSIGTTISFGPSGLYDPKSRYFIYECDEYDYNFLHFHPHLSIIPALGYDHIDIFPTKAIYDQAFQAFFDQSKTVIMWQSDATEHAQPKAGGHLLQKVQNLKLAGAHNRRNASLVIEALENLQLTQTDDFPIDSDFANIIERFPGTQRRFERLAPNIYSDYGHLPPEIAATLQMSKEIGSHTVLVYQPHQNVRQHAIRDDYTDQLFENADEIYWLPTFEAREQPDLAILSPSDLTAHLQATVVHQAIMSAELWQTIKRHQAAGHTVICMGLGDIDDWARTMIRQDSEIDSATDQQGSAS